MISQLAILISPLILEPLCLRSSLSIKIQLLYLSEELHTSLSKQILLQVIDLLHNLTMRKELEDDLTKTNLDSIYCNSHITVKPSFKLIKN